MIRVRPRLLAVLVLNLAALCFAATHADAYVHSSARATTVTTGWDVSWPQCGASLPRSGSFAVVGVTGGRPWGANACLGSEYSWAARRSLQPGLYMNTANPAPHSSFYWPSSGAQDPALCADNTSVADPGCAYDYGWHAAADALATAASALAARGFPSSSALADAWWLDAETGNSWNGTGAANAADVQGSIDYLRSAGVATVGIYSTSYQWGVITGGYTTATAAGYAAAWEPEFTTAYGIGGSPDWVAGAGSQRQALSNCGRSFTGVAVRLAQYPASGLDGDVVCR